MVIKSVAVEGARDDGFYFQNKMLITLGGKCGEKNITHTDITNPIMNSFLSIALSAKAMGKKVNVGINTSNQTKRSNQLAYISFSLEE